MAIFKTGTSETEIPDGTALDPAVEEVGVSFGCHHGVCGACTVTVLEGMENLSAKSDAENDFDLEADQRLMCQCSITSGTVKAEV